MYTPPNLRTQPELYPIVFADNLTPPKRRESRGVIYQRCLKYMLNIPDMWAEQTLKIYYQVAWFISFEYQANKTKELGGYLEQLDNYAAFSISKDILKAAYYNI